MRRFITQSLELFSKIAIALILLVATWAGASGAGFGGAVLGFLYGLVISVIGFGVIFLLMDIADNTRRSADALANLYLEQHKGT